MRNLALLLITLLSLKVLGQTEQITIMQYNLTYYGNTGGTFIGCDNTNNDTDDKNAYLDTIISEILPDVFGVNELGYNFQLANSILSNALNTNGRSYYDMANFNGYGDIANQLYYNKNKFGMYSEDFIDKDLNGDWLVRHIDFHTLYFKDADLAETKDTIFLTFIVAHLKAGSSASDQSDRDKATAAVMSYLENNNVKGYKFFMGDINMKTSNEAGYQNLINYSNSTYNFVDPINQPGTWNNSAAYANIHTQSTRSSDDNGGCFITGGMDDRYDVILMDNTVDNSASKIHYLNGSYMAFGNDGGAFNGDLRISNNTAVSSIMAQTLYDMSDHLPVIMQIEIEGTSGLTEEQKDISIIYNNPLQDVISISSKSHSKMFVDLYNISGSKIYSNVVQDHLQISTSNIMSGIYILRVQNLAGDMIIKKLVK